MTKEKIKKEKPKKPKYNMWQNSCWMIGTAWKIKEKKVIFQRFALRKVFERMGMKEEECVLTEDGLDAVIKLHENTSGIRDLEQAAEHLAANALYQIEVDKVKQVVFDAEAVFELLG